MISANSPVEAEGAAVGPRVRERLSMSWREVGGFIVVAVLTGLLNRPGLGFEIAGGVALIYPASAVIVVGGLLFGFWWTDYRSRKRHGGIRIY